jgi:hypothetical protein
MKFPFHGNEKMSRRNAEVRLRTREGNQQNACEPGAKGGQHLLDIKGEGRRGRMKVRSGLCKAEFVMNRFQITQGNHLQRGEGREGVVGGKRGK